MHRPLERWAAGSPRRSQRRTQPQQQQEEAKYPSVATRDGDDDDDDPFAEAEATPLARTRVAPPSPPAAAAAAEQPMERFPAQLQSQDAHWFTPQADQHYRRKEAAALTATVGAFSAPVQAAPPSAAGAAAAASVATLPRPSTVDGTLTAAEARAAEKALFIASWTRAQEQALGMAPGSSSLPPAPAAPAPPGRAKVAFRPLPTAHLDGPGFKYFPDDSPPSPGALDSLDASLARSVVFLPLSTASAGVHAKGAAGGAWKGMSSWSQIEFNREGMKLEESTRGNAKGTAEGVLHSIWRKANNIPAGADAVAWGGGVAGAAAAASSAKPSKPKSELLSSAPVYRHRLPSGSVLLSSAPPATGPLVPPTPPATRAGRLKVDRLRERQAMGDNDWNVAPLSGDAVLNPYDPAQRLRRDELQRAASRAAKGLLGSRPTEAERIARRNVERERMVYEDCNAAGKLTKSSYRFIPKIPNRKLYATSWGPAYFAAGGPFLAGNEPIPFAPIHPPGSVPFAPPSTASWAALGATPLEAWKAHQKNLSRERTAMGAEDFDARTGVRYTPPETESAAKSRIRSTLMRERSAMASQDYNVVSGGIVPRAGIYTAHQGLLDLSTRRGGTFKPMKVYRSGYSLCPHRWGQTDNKHAKDPRGARFFKRSFDAMSGRHIHLLDGADQSTNLLDKKPAAAPSPIVTQQLGFAGGVELLSHGQAYSQRTRCKYRYVDRGGGFTGVSSLPPAGSPAAIAAAAAPPLVVAPPAPVLDRHGNPIRKRHAPRAPLIDQISGGRPRPGSSNDPQRIGTNRNSIFTLIPRWNEPDAPCDPSATPAHLAAVAALKVKMGAKEVDLGAQMNALRGHNVSSGGPFRFDDSLPYIFAPAVPWNNETQWRLANPGGAPASFRASQGRSLEEDMANFPYDASKRLFKFPARLERLARRAQRNAQHVRALREAAAMEGLPPPRKIVWKYLSEFRAAEDAEEQRLREFTYPFGIAPWSAGSTIPGAATTAAGAFGTAGSFFQPGDRFGLFNPAPAPQTELPFGPRPPQKLPASFAEHAIARSAPSTSVARSSGAAASPASTSSSSTFTSPLDALAAQLASVNPFQSPEQRAQLAALHERDRAALEAAEAAREAEKRDRRHRKQERAAASASPLGFTDKEVTGATRFYPAEPVDFNKSKHKTASFSPARSAVPSTSHTSTLGRSSNPYSQVHAFEAWSAWNAKHAPTQFGTGATTATNGKYTFHPLPVRTDGLDTSDEDDSDEELHGSFSASSPGGTSKRKLDAHTSPALSRTSPFEIGLDSSHNITLSKFGTAQPFSAPSPTRQQRQQQRQASRSPAARRRQAMRSRSASPVAGGFMRAQDLETRRRERERIQKREAERERSLSPFSYHDRARSPMATRAPVAQAVRSTTAAPFSSTSSELFPAQRSSVPFHRGIDSGAPLMHDPLAAFGQSSSFGHFTVPTSFQSRDRFVDPPSLGSFHTGFDSTGGSAGAGFIPFNARFPSVHSSAGTVAVPNALSPSPSKRLKAVRRDRGAKRSVEDEEARGFAGYRDGRVEAAVEAREWEAAREREEWRREQEEAARFMATGGCRGSTQSLGRNGSLYSTHSQAEQHPPQHSPINVHIHSGNATATMDSGKSRSDSPNHRPRSRAPLYPVYDEYEAEEEVRIPSSRASTRALGVTAPIVHAVEPSSYGHAEDDEARARAAAVAAAAAEEAQSAADAAAQAAVDAAASAASAVGESAIVRHFMEELEAQRARDAAAQAREREREAKEAATRAAQTQFPSTAPSQRSSRRSSNASAAAMRAAAAAPLPASSSSSSAVSTPRSGRSTARSSAPAPSGPSITTRPSVFGWQESTLQTDRLAPALREPPVLSSSSPERRMSPQAQRRMSPPPPVTSRLSHRQGTSRSPQRKSNTPQKKWR